MEIDSIVFVEECVEFIGVCDLVDFCYDIVKVKLSIVGG